MKFDIGDFLPYYPSIKDDANFIQDIYRKEEFDKLKLDRIEEVPVIPGDLMKHQQIIARFLSSRTPYDSLLLVHEMGTGKTCSSVAVIEQIKSETDSGFTGALILAKGSGLLKNYTNEVVFRCTDGSYIPENYETLPENLKNIRLAKSISSFYQLRTFEKFAKFIKRSSDETLKRYYSNKIIVLDEVHNLREKNKKKGLDIYKEYHRFLHVVENCKILLMSGTPMKDGVDEISSIMNLILPENGQFKNTGKDFIKEYFNVSDGLYTLKSKKVKSFKKKLKGRVSYLKSMESDVMREFIGKKNVGKLKEFTVNVDKMSDFQHKSYKEAFEKDKSENSVYINSRQALLFVYPDGSYGKKGFDKYFTKNDTKLIDNKSASYSMTKALRDAIKGENEAETLENIEKYSSKYAKSIRNILSSKDKIVFIYNEFVKGSGCILFSKLLEFFDITKASGTDSTKKRRYALITNETTTQKKQRKLIERSNKPDNMTAEYINVIVGSGLMREGFTLKNVQVEDVMTPHWNYSETAQALARGYRLGSHNDLVQAGLSPKLEINQRVSVYKKELDQSQDLIMYELSEIKDMNIKTVERFIKTASFDCHLTRERNYVKGVDGTRECDYAECEYKCDGESEEPDVLDSTTYNLYYIPTDRIIGQVIPIFRTHFNITIKELTTLLPEYREFEIFTAMRKIINESIPVTDRYGFLSYVSGSRDNFYITNSISIDEEFPSEYYSKFPTIYEKNTFLEIIGIKSVDNMENITAKICASKDEKEVRKLADLLDRSIVNMMIEGSIEALDRQIVSTLRDSILKIYKGYYREYDGGWVQWFKTGNKDSSRCYKNHTWRDCGGDIIEDLKKEEGDLKERLETNPYGVYGLKNTRTEDFCVKKTRLPGVTDIRKQPKGKRCIHWEKHEILRFIIKVMKIDPADKTEELSLKETRKKVLETKSLKKIYKTKKDVEASSIEELRRALYWTSIKVNNLCVVLEDWFVKNDMILNDNTCGVQGVKKIKNVKK